MANLSLIWKTEMSNELSAQNIYRNIEFRIKKNKAVSSLAG